MTVRPNQHLQDEDIYELIVQYQQHPTEEVKTKLVLQYEDLVRSLARKFSKGNESFEDLVQVGMLGLINALDRFDFSHERSFKSFAVPTIVGEMKRYLRDKTWSVHVPRRIKELSPKIKKAVEQLSLDLQRSPTFAEIAEFVQASEEEVLEAVEMGQSYRALSVDSAVETDAEGSTVTLLDLVGQKEEGYEHVQHRLLFEKVFSALSEKEKQVIELTYIHHMSQKEAGQKLGISQMHVSRLQRRAIKKMQEVIKDTDTVQSESLS